MMTLVSTLYPSLIIITLLFSLLRITAKVEYKKSFHYLILGAISVIPAFAVISFLTIGLFPLAGVELSAGILLIISSLNEEIFKILFIWLANKKETKIPYALLTGAGFALIENVFLSMGNREEAIIRAITTLILHVITAGFAGWALKKKSVPLFLIPVVMHLLYNYLIR